MVVKVQTTSQKTVIKQAKANNVGSIYVNTIKTQSTGNFNRLDQLSDVVEINPTNGSTLVYDDDTDRYVVKMMDLDGGEF